MSIRSSGRFAGIASAAVAVAVFTNSSPAAAPGSSGTQARLSNIRHEICSVRAQSNWRKSRADSARRRLRRADRARKVAPARRAKASNLKCAEVGRRVGRIELSVPKIADPAAAMLGFALSLAAQLFALLGPAPARAQDPVSTPSRPWLEPALLPAAKSEGSLIVYSSTNEPEGLPLFKLFTDATGIKVEYVRASDAVLMSRMGIEFRADQKSYDIVQTATINKMPAQMLAAYEPPEANHVSPNARDPNRRWYGVYANYNSPAYNTERVKVSELPGSYEEFAQR